MVKISLDVSMPYQCYRKTSINIKMQPNSKKKTASQGPIHCSYFFRVFRICAPGKFQSLRAFFQVPVSGREACSSGFTSNAQAGKSTNLALKVYSKQGWLSWSPAFLLFFTITGFVYTLGFMKYKSC